MDFSVTGTMIWYFYICRREVWLMAHSLEADQEHQDLEIGRILHESSYKRRRKEIDLGHIKVDLISKQNEKLVIGEVKKSSSFKKSARMQLAYYIQELKERGYEVEGYLQFPEEKNREKVELNDRLSAQLDKTVEKIKTIAGKEHPPEVEKIKYCRKCAYEEFCWA